MKVISKRFTLFGNTFDYLSENIGNLIKEYPSPEYSITRFADNITPLEQTAGLSIKNLKKRENIKIYANRIDFEFEAKLPSFEEAKETIYKFLGLKSDLLYTRIAVGVVLVEQDKKNFLKTKLSNCIHNSFNSVNDFSFRLNEIVKKGEEEVNCILSSNSGFVQEIKVVNNMQFPQLLSALYFNIDINTSQKNSVERFTCQHIGEVFPLLDDESNKYVEIILEMINNEKK